MYLFEAYCNMPSKYELNIKAKYFSTYKCLCKYCLQIMLANTYVIADIQKERDGRQARKNNLSEQNECNGCCL